MRSRYAVTVLLDVRPRRLSWASLVATAMLATGCRAKPPVDFAPAPELVDRIREIRITPLQARACPGQNFRVSYDAILDDGTRVPFESRYDKKAPPRLHVQFLSRTSTDAYPQGDGSWVANRDPWLTMKSGFRVNAALIAKPAASGSARLDPDYTCMDHTYNFRGRTGSKPTGKDAAGRPGGPGGDGPDVTVRVGIVKAPFMERMLVAAIEVGEAPPEYYVADATMIKPRDWLVIETRGGAGGKGADGEKGSAGAAGTQGCPGGTGGPGGNGGNGGAGGSGGRGGRITIITASEDPFLAGIVDARNQGGEGGEGGKGGGGGAGGAGGAAIRAECAPGAAGPAGREGTEGRVGQIGQQGQRPQVITVPLREVFGQRIPPELAELLAGGNRQ